MTKTPIIVSIGGSSISEYVKLAKELDKIKGLNGIEMNISCPNVKNSNRMISQDKAETYRFVDTVRQVTNMPLIIKLSPNWITS